MAFKMKGSPMYRNYGIGTPMKNGKPVPGATDELLKGLGAMGTGGSVDPEVVKNKEAEASRAVRTPAGYDDMGDDERQVARKNMADEIARKGAMADRMAARDVTEADVASQAKQRARAKNRG
jgi:hypothetical protein